ncbi:hypothetical protein [Kribbella sp. CA-293567]|uniref:hypothetical protein n=1 Tax=Kribbella sp. CA-293567 TaxID=3002436 RepID=UPI0022DE6130|nr:hypothetical protein [Kribbella sp. CA-293567]WBQ06398.1 hypothetical protein OX958_06310 [Kribbella sp. CA-293567]
MPEPDEQEFGPQIADAFQSKAHTVQGLRASGFAKEARRRVHKRRQRLATAAAAVVVVVAIGGVWGVIGGPSPVTTSSSDSAGSAAGGTAERAPVVPKATSACPPQHPILRAGGHEAVPSGTGLDLDTQVYGLEACRYRLAEGDQFLLGSATFSASTAQQVVDAIKVLPERNPALPVFKCTPETARPKEAIVLRFDTATGVREVWVGYDGCASAGFFTGNRTYGLFPAPLKLFLKDSVRPTTGLYLNHLEGW